MAGYTDCARYDARIVAFVGVSYELLRDAVNDHYRTDSELSKSVPDVLMALAPGARPKARPGGEAYPEPHGFYDGEYWRKSVPDHRIGFVEGYVECWKVNRLRGAAFSRPAGWYVSKISEWFGTTGVDADYKPERRDLKIADALRRFRD